MEPIVRTIFNAETKQEFLASHRTYFGSGCHMKKLTSGTKVLCFDSSTLQIFAIATLGTFPSGEVCRPHHQLDTDVYSPEHAKYNKYDICIDRIRVFNTPIDCDNLAKLLSIDKTIVNNITKRNNINFGSLFYKSDNEQEVLERIRIWLSTLEL